MELKHVLCLRFGKPSKLLIVPYGIETISGGGDSGKVEGF